MTRFVRRCARHGCPLVTTRHGGLRCRRSHPPDAPLRWGVVDLERRLVVAVATTKRVDIAPEAFGDLLALPLHRGRQ